MKPWMKISLFIVVVVLVFLVLWWMTIPRSLDRQDIIKGTDQLLAMDGFLSQDPVDWNTVKDNYKGRLARLVTETDRFAEDIHLDSKIKDAIEEGIHGNVSDIQAVILKRTLLRTALYHIEALITSTTEPEISMDMDEKIFRMEPLLRVVYRFVEEASPEKATLYRQNIKKAYEAWKAKPNQVEEEAFHQTINGVICDFILNQLDQWRELDPSDRKQRLKAVEYQADMRQLFHIPYPRYMKIEKKKAWVALTEFANMPEKMDDNAIEESVRFFAGNQLKNYEASTQEGE